jgi:hypothetical protein
MPPYHSFSNAQYSYGPGTSTVCSTNSFETSSLKTVYQPSTTPHPFTLKFLTARITKCQGCKQLFRSSEHTPPHDLIVARLECRPFVAPDGAVKVSTTAKNSHYHLCIQC